MPNRELYGIFPKLRGSQFRITSPPDKNYNCIAWVLGKTREFWTPYGTIIPASFPPYFWPPNIPQDESIGSVIRLFEEQGYEASNGSEHEAGFEKLALFQQDGYFTHVAKQRPNGKWSSKLGDLEDIEHDELRPLERQSRRYYGGRPVFYGRATHFLKRRTRRRAG